MSDELYVDTDGLQNAAANLSQLTSRVVSIASQLQGTLNALGQPWGNDDTGEQFASKYEGPADQIMQGINSIGSVLDSTVQGLGTMANGYTATEEQNRASINLASGSSQSGADQLRSAERSTAPLMAREAAVPAQTDTPLQPAERLEAREASTPLQPAQRDLAEPLQPAEPATPATNTPLQPAQRLETREADTPLQPSERLDGRAASTPLQPAERLEAREATKPAQPREARTPETRSRESRKHPAGGHETAARKDTVREQRRRAVRDEPADS